MQIEDLRSLQASAVETDLCIVGSGPAGLSVAKEFIGTRTRVLIVESGGLAEDPDLGTLSAVECVGLPRDMDQFRVRMFGGNSHVWAGRCAPLDDLDFEHRSWIPFSGWPIRRADLDPYLDRAAANLGLAPSCREERLWERLGVPRPEPYVDRDLLEPVIWQFSADAANPREPVRCGPRFRSLAAENIRVLLYATATHITTNDAGTRLESLEISTPEGRRATIRARAVVLCAGAIENARLMLASDRIHRNGVGNDNDLVGRFLMDHPRCTLGELDPKRSRRVHGRFGMYRLDDGTGAHFLLRGLALSPRIQKDERLLNCAAWLVAQRAADDPWDAVRRLVSLGRRGRYQDVRHVLSQPALISRGLYHLVRGGEPPQKVERLQLVCDVEQRPNPDSRLCLSDRKDSFGTPLPRLDWRIDELEKVTARRLGQILAGELARMGAPPRLADWVQTGRLDQAEFTDAAHPAGTTRMARDPREGVVDPNCQVHGVDGLFVAGSSVFPAEGHTNPTLTIVALAIRLADWLKTRILGQQPVAPAAPVSDLDLALRS